jgi:hypothetical protein
VVRKEKIRQEREELAYKAREKEEKGEKERKKNEEDGGG